MQRRRTPEEGRLNSEIAVRLKEGRLKKEPHMSQEKLGIALGVSFQQIQKYENGHDHLSAAKLIMAARALDLSPAFLLTGKA